MSTQANQVKLTAKVQHNGRHFLFDQEGKKVGESWRIHGKREWGLSLPGVYWRMDRPNSRSGSSGTSRKSLRDCVALAEQTLNSDIPPKHQ